MKNLILLALFTCAGCATGSHIITGKARPLVVAEGVRIYPSMPANVEIIGIVNASFASSGQRATDKVIEELKKQAGEIGANGVVIGNTSSQQEQTTTGFSSGGNSFIGSTSGNTSISGTAIFIP